MAQKLDKENWLKQQEISCKYGGGNNETLMAQKTYQPAENVSQYSTYEQTQDENMYTLKSESFEKRVC